MSAIGFVVVFLMIFIIAWIVVMLVTRRRRLPGNIVDAGLSHYSDPAAVPGAAILVTAAATAEMENGSSPGDTELKGVIKLDEGLKLAQALIISNKMGEGLDVFSDLRIRFPNHPAAYVLAANVLSKKGNLDEAETLLDEAISRFPNNPSPAVDRVWLLHRRNDWVEANNRWGSVRDRFPQQPGGYIGGAQSLRKLGRADDADQLLTEAVQKNHGGPALLVELARGAEQRKDWSSAYDFWEKLRNQFPAQIVGSIGAARCLKEMGHVVGAANVLDEANERFPDEPAVAVDRAWLMNHQRRWDDAGTYWDAVRKRFPLQVAGYLGGAQAARALGRSDEAEVLLGTAVGLFPNLPGPLVEHARLAHQRKDWIEASRRWQNVRALVPDSIEAQTGAAEALSECNGFSEVSVLAAEGTARIPAGQRLLAISERPPEE